MLGDRSSPTEPGKSLGGRPPEAQGVTSRVKTNPTSSVFQKTRQAVVRRGRSSNRARLQSTHCEHSKFTLYIEGLSQTTGGCNRKFHSHSNNRIIVPSSDKPKISSTRLFEIRVYLFYLSFTLSAPFILVKLFQLLKFRL